MRTALYAFLVVAFGAIGHLPSHAGEISIAGYTNGCFNCASVPDASTPQDASSLGLLFENALFQGTTSAGILALGGVAPGSVPPFSDVLGTVRLSTAYADYTTKSFNLRVTFSAPVGIVSGNGSVWQATLAGAVYSTDSGGVFIDFDNTPQSFSYTGASGVGSFQFSVNDVAIEPGQTATITGQVMQADGVPPWNPICPSNIEVNQDIGVCSASVSLPAGNTQTSGDMLASQPVLSYFVAGQTISWPHTFPVGITVVHVEDGLGWSCNFTVRVKDNEPSVLTDCPADQTVPMEFGKNSAVVNFNMPSVADCSPTTLSATLPSGTTLGMGTFPISIIAIDSGGYRSTCSFTIKVVDTQSPVPDVPELPTVNSACYAKVAPPTATDNFAGKISASTTDATEFNAQGVYTITWVYNDGNGNTAQQQQTVIVQDTENPKVQCPAPLSIPMEGSSAAIPDLKIGLQISDNCTPKELLVVTQVPAPGSSVGPGNYTVVLTVIDAAGNQTTCEAVVNILSSQPIAPSLAPAVSTETTGIVVGQSYATQLPGELLSGVSLADLPTRQPGVAAMGSVFQIEPGPSWGYYIDAYRAGIPYSVKNVVLEKQTPATIQCADVFPSMVVRQQGTKNIRLWWPLLYELPGTKWTLTILYGTSNPVELKGDISPSYVHKEEWNWEVTSDLIDLQNLLTAFHTLPYGLNAVPLISDETLYLVLHKMLADAQSAYVAKDMVTASLFLGDFEMALADACITASPRWPNPTGPGTGISQTHENPACCTLDANAEYVMRVLGIGLPAKR